MLGRILINAARGDKLVRVVPRGQMKTYRREFMEQLRPQLEKLEAAKRRSWEHARHMVLD